MVRVLQGSAYIKKSILVSLSLLLQRILANFEQQMFDIMAEIILKSNTSSQQSHSGVSD